MATSALETILAQAKNLSDDELAQLVRRAAELLARSTTQPRPRYVDLFGAGKGSFASVKEVDRFVREERDAWDE